jgi:hypothetical protein
MEFDSESGFVDLTGNTTDDRAQASLSYLKSYRGMGVAEVACVAGCTCRAQVLDGTWATEVSLQQILQFWVSCCCHFCCHFCCCWTLELRCGCLL